MGLRLTTSRLSTTHRLCSWASTIASTAHRTLIDTSNKYRQRLDYCGTNRLTIHQLRIDYESDESTTNRLRASTTIPRSFANHLKSNDLSWIHDDSFIHDSSFHSFTCDTNANNIVVTSFRFVCHSPDGKISFKFVCHSPDGENSF